MIEDSIVRRIKSILFWGFMATASMYTLLYLISYPVSWDDWMYVGGGNLVKIPFDYSRSSSFHGHPGRNFSMAIDHLFGTVFSSMLNGTIGNPVTKMRVVRGSGSTLSIFMLWAISTLFVLPFNRQHKFSLKTAVVFIVLMSSAFAGYSAGFIALQLWGGFVFALLCFTPILYYYKHNRLPDFVHRNPYYWGGVSLAVLYCGSAIQDTGYFMICALMGMALLGFALRMIFPWRFEQGEFSIKKHKFLLCHIIIYFIFSGIALFLNIYHTGQWSGRSQRFTARIDIIYQRVFESWYIGDFVIIVGIILMLFYGIKILFKLFNSALEKITTDEFFIFSSTAAGFAIVIVCSTIGTGFPQALWVMGLAEIRFLLLLLDKKNPIAQLGTPMALVILLCATIIDFQKTKRTGLLTIDYQIYEIFKSADQKGLTEIELTSQALQELGIDPTGTYPPIAHTLKLLGGIKNDIKIVVKTNGS